MNKLIEVVYERGILRPVHPLHLPEGESIHVVLVDVPSSTPVSSARWDPSVARAAMKEIASLPIRQPADGAAVGRDHDRYLYGDLSDFAKDRRR